MPKVEPIPFTPSQRSGLEPLAGGGVVAFNVVMDNLGAVRKRPGIRQYTTGVFDEASEGQPIHAIKKPAERNIYVFASVEGASDLRAAWRVADDLASAAEVAPGPFAASKRLVIAETTAMLAIAGGQAPQKLVTFPGDPEENRLSDLADAPIGMTHVVGNSSRLVGNDPNDNPEMIRYSAQAAGSSTSGHEDWSIGASNGGFVTAESRPGRVLAMAENTAELFVWKRRNLQVFSPDGIFGYVPIATRESGIAAPYSITRRDQQFAWLDHLRRFVASDGRGYEGISGDIQKTLDDMETVEDAFGYRVSLGPVDAMIWTFPTDGRTFVYQNGLWSQWSGWRDGNWARFLVNCHELVGETSENIVGTTDGRVGILDLDTTTDLGDPIQAEIQTGFLNRGTDAYKQCIAVHVALRRGSTSSATGPEAWLFWRDRPGAWQGQIPISLGASGDTEIVVPLRSLGTYRRREWGFRFSGSHDLRLVRVTEEFQVLES